MNFTREPIVETVVSPREGCKLVIRNSKSAGQEEYLVDAIEIVRFGSALFFRSLERPKSFILPVSDYEVMEVRETRVVLKHAVSGEKPSRPERRKRDDRREVREPRKPEAKKPEAKKPEAKTEETSGDEPKPKRRRQRRRKRDDEGAPAEGATPSVETDGQATEGKSPAAKSPVASPAVERAPSTLLPPPTTLISDSIGHYKKLMTEAEAEGPVKKSEAAEPVSDKIEEPALVPPGAEVQTDAAAKGLGVFSAGRFLRRLAGQEKEEGESTPEE